MAKKLKMIFSIIAAIVLIAAIGTAFPSIPTYDPGGMPNIPPVIGPSNPGSTSSGAEPNDTMSDIPDMNSIFRSWPPVQTPTENPYNESGTAAGLEHPAQEPQAEIPAFKPSANTWNVVVTTGEKQVLASQDIMASFSSEPQSESDGASDQSGYANIQYYLSPPQPSPPKPSGIKIWALYNGMWTMGPSGVSQFQQMNLIMKNNRWQNLWGYDSNSFPQWTFWGYMGPGFIPSTFYADTKGWHMCAIWGSVSGFSNTLPIFVW
jgi:hypothetical protein